MNRIKSDFISQLSITVSLVAYTARRSSDRPYTFYTGRRSRTQRP